MMNPGPPRVLALLADAAGDTLHDGDQLAGLDVSNMRQLHLEAFDETGIDRLVVEGPDPDYSGNITESLPPGATTYQRVDYDVSLPVRPLDHTLTLKVFDTSSLVATDLAYTLNLSCPQTAVFYLDGEPIEPQNVPLQAEVPLDMTAEVHCSAWLDPEWDIQLRGNNLTLDNVQIQRRDAYTLDLAFTATAAKAQTQDRAVVLSINGYESVYDFPEPDAAPFGIAEIYAFPNPMHEDTRFVIQTDLPPASGSISIYSVAGRQIASLRIRPAHFMGSDAAVVPWDGRDGRGDRLANGVYLYRVEIDAPTGRITSDMQRLVMMQ
jgi:hypothetical protein